MTRKLLISADDFGLSVEVNEAIEIAHRQGILKTANLMITGEAVDDAIKRAKKMPDLQVGLHLVVIEGKSILSQSEIPFLVDQNNLFPSQPFKMGVNYFFNTKIKQQLRKEITAQLQAFKNTGLRLDHLDVHKHMHLHPTVAQLIMEIGKDFNLNHIRLPREPVQILKLVDQSSWRDNFNNFLLYYWTIILEQQIKKAGMKHLNWCFGLSWCGHMTFDRIQKLIPHLPDGNSEMFFHPAIKKAGLYHELMPDYEPVKELETLCHPDFPKLLQAHNIQPISWTDIT